MRRIERNKHKMDGLLSLLVFSVFASCILLVLLSGANAYERLTQRDQASYQLRTCTQLFATNVRQAPQPEQIAVVRFGDGDCLCIPESVDGARYEKRLYCYDGWLCELYADAALRFSPEDGERLLQLDRLEAELRDGLLTLRLTLPDRGTARLALSLRTGEEAGLL